MVVRSESLFLHVHTGVEAIRHGNWLSGCIACTVQRNASILG